MSNSQEDHCRPERDPKQGKDSVTDRVIQDLIKRREFGVKKYGGELKTHNGRQTKIDKYQEALDYTLYCKQDLMEQVDYLDVIRELSVALKGLSEWYTNYTGVPAVAANKALKYMVEKIGPIE